MASSGNKVEGKVNRREKFVGGFRSEIQSTSISTNLLSTPVFMSDPSTYFMEAGFPLAMLQVMLLSSQLQK
ncbi:unnamed protein product [Rodentolepis nana]|uniref:Ovule protein n=1 Tax=Rodentolepis nana TaxID=102285 RepID=A0A0R3T7Y9_RODNA|nr:unnamed protein product [Rodentolepis nana]